MSLAPVPALATLTVMTEGEATLRDGDVPFARELAIQRALSRAAETAGFTIRAETRVGPDGVSESARITSQACVSHYTTLYEYVGPDTVTVMLDVSLDPDGTCEQAEQAEQALRCEPGARKHLLVTGFAFEFPEQRRLEEDVRVETLIARPLANALATQRATTSAAAANLFPYRNAAAAPETGTSPGAPHPLAESAQAAGADYVLSGVFRDFQIGKELIGFGTRRITIEAFLHDGGDGSVLARKTFTRDASGAILVRRAPASNSATARGNTIETALHALIGDIASWAAGQVACQP